MAHSVSHATNAQHAAQVQQSHQNDAPKPAPKNTPPPQDKVTISEEAHAAHKSAKG